MSDVSGLYLCLYLQVELSQHVLHFVFSAIWESVSQAQILQWQEDALQNPQKNFFGKKIVMAMIDIICLFCEICLCLLRQKSKVVMITLEFKPKIFWPRFMFFPTCVIGCCPLFLQDVFAADTSKRKKWMPQNTLLCVAISYTLVRLRNSGRCLWITFLLE